MIYAMAFDMLWGKYLVYIAIIVPMQTLRGIKATRIIKYADLLQVSRQKTFNRSWTALTQQNVRHFADAMH